jgi:hypothetical protein
MAAGGEGEASDGEARAIGDILQAHPWPVPVKGFELEFGEDSTGDPAVWIWLMIADDEQPSSQKMRELSQFRREVQSAITAAGVSRWLHVRFRARQHSEH